MPTWNADSDRRLLLALLASNNDIKISNARIAEIYGNATKDSVEHRFRVLKKEAKAMVTE
jgi:hypothetical protein